MPLFALFDKSVAVSKIQRIHLDKAASKEIDTLFRTQTSHFESHHNSIINFYAGYEPKYNESFELDNFIDSSILFDAIDRPTAYPKWDPSKLDIDNIKALFTGVGDKNNPKKIAIQTFNKKQILDTSKSFIMGLVSSANTFSKASNVGFNVDEKLVAVINDNKIQFRSFFKLRSIFDMSSYFTLATDQDLDIFTRQPVFSLPPNFDLKSVADTVIRTKVTLLNQTGMLTPANLKTFKREAKKVKYKLETITENGVEKIVMPELKKDIKNLLDFLEEDIWVSGISGRVFKAGSKRPI